MQVIAALVSSPLFALIQTQVPRHPLFRQWQEAMQTAALIVAAGRGTRLGGELPKQYLLLNGEPVLRRTVYTFMTHPCIDQNV